MSTSERRLGHVQSVDRAVSVLELLSKNGLSGVTEIANLLDIHKSTAYRLIATLEARGLVEQDVESEKYQLGFGLVSLASSVTAEMDIVRRARSLCEQLSDEMQETVTLTALEGDEPVVLFQCVSSSSVLSVDWTGSESPIHCTAAGKIFLAHMSERRRNRLISRPLERFTEYTKTDPSELRAQFEQIRACGYGYTIEELEIGLTATGAPVFSIDGKVIAVISVSSPSARLPMEQVPEMGERIKVAAAELSRRIGYHAEIHRREN